MYGFAVFKQSISSHIVISNNNNYYYYMSVVNSGNSSNSLKISHAFDIVLFFIFHLFIYNFFFLAVVSPLIWTIECLRRLHNTKFVLSIQLFKPFKWKNLFQNVAMNLRFYHWKEQFIHIIMTHAFSFGCHGENFFRVFFFFFYCHSIWCNFFDSFLCFHFRFAHETTHENTCWFIQPFWLQLKSVNNSICTFVRA